jgi:hypothetical protein
VPKSIASCSIAPEAAGRGGLDKSAVFKVFTG